MDMLFVIKEADAPPQKIGFSVRSGVVIIKLQEGLTMMLSEYITHRIKLAPETHVPFSRIKQGEQFTFEGVLHVKLEEAVEGWNVCNVVDGVMGAFLEDTTVELVNIVPVAKEKAKYAIRIVFSTEECLMLITSLYAIKRNKEEHSPEIDIAHKEMVQKLINKIVAA